MLWTLLRALLLASAILLAMIGLLTTFMLPVWIGWRWRIGLSGVAGEYGHVLAVLTLGAAIFAWALGRQHRTITSITLGVCVLALTLTLKPTLQACLIGRALPAQLARAFGPLTPRESPFSLVSLLARRPAPVPVQTMHYRGDLKLDFYRAIGRSPAPCVVVIHGGAWCAGSRDELSPMDCLLARRGYAVAAIDYRLAPAATWPAQRDDVRDALAFLRGRATELAIDPARIVLLGRSAGGQIALATAYGASDAGIRGVISYYGPTDMNFSWATAKPHDSFPHHQVLGYFLGGTPQTAPAAFNQASAIQIVSASAPPTLLIQGGLDPIVSRRQADMLADKLASLGVAYTLLGLPWSTHGFDFINFDGPGEQLAGYSVQWFLAAVTR